MRVGAATATTGVLGVIAALGLSGCGGGTSPEPTPVTLAEAPAHYESILADVRDAVDDAAGPLDWSWSERSLVPWAVAEGSCPYWSPEWQADDSIAAEDAWARVVELLEPVLAEHGFGTPEVDGQGVGGWALVKAEDGRGAVLSLRSKSHTELSVSGGSVLLGSATSCPTEGAS